MDEQYLTDNKVAERFSSHKSWVWRRMKDDPTFPRPYKFSNGCSRWKLSELEHWEKAHEPAPVK